MKLNSFLPIVASLLLGSCDSVTEQVNEIEATSVNLTVVDSEIKILRTNLDVMEVIENADLKAKAEGLTIVIHTHQTLLNILNSGRDHNRPCSETELFQATVSWEMSKGLLINGANGLEALGMNLDPAIDRIYAFSPNKFNKIVEDPWKNVILTCTDGFHGHTIAEMRSEDNSAPELVLGPLFFKLDTCSQFGILAHELAHLAGQRHHDKDPRGDLAYDIGDTAYDLCMQYPK